MVLPRSDKDSHEILNAKKQCGLSDGSEQPIEAYEQRLYWRNNVPLQCYRNSELDQLAREGKNHCPPGWRRLPSSNTSRCRELFEHEQGRDKIPVCVREDRSSVPQTQWYKWKPDGKCCLQNTASIDAECRPGFCTVLKGTRPCQQAIQSFCMGNPVGSSTGIDDPDVGNKCQLWFQSTANQNAISNFCTALPTDFNERTTRGRICRPWAYQNNNAEDARNAVYSYCDQNPCLAGYRRHFGIPTSDEYGDTDIVPAANPPEEEESFFNKYMNVWVGMGIIVAIVVLIWVATKIWKKIRSKDEKQRR